MRFRRWLSAHILLITTTTLVSCCTAMTSSPLPSQTQQQSSLATGLSLGGEKLRELVTRARQSDEATTLDLDQGITWMEHCNFVVGSKTLAEIFYRDLLGFTRDAGKSFHFNLGQQQFHLAENGDPPQKITGSIGLVVPSLETLRERIDKFKQEMEGSQFQVLQDTNKSLTLVGPWGNLFHIYSQKDDCLEATTTSTKKMVNMHAEGGQYGFHRMSIRGQPGIRFVEVACPPNSASKISRFYREMLGCTTYESPEMEATVVCTGPGVHVVFRETSALSETDSRAMEGVHICIYVPEFKDLYERLQSRNLIWTNPRFTHLDSCDTWEEAKASRTLRFKDIIDLESGEVLLELEHESRPLRHGQFLKVPKYEPV